MGAEGIRRNANSVRFRGALLGQTDCGLAVLPGSGAHATHPDVTSGFQGSPDTRPVGCERYFHCGSLRGSVVPISLFRASRGGNPCDLYSGSTACSIVAMEGAASRDG